MASRMRLVAVGTAVLASTLVLSSCGSSSSTGDSTKGAITVNGSEPQNPLIPALTNETGGGNVVDGMFTRLVRYDPKTAEPQLAMAESIESSDNKVWDIKLKEGWTFHDGTPVTAKSFVDAWNWGAACSTGANNQYFFGPDGVNIAGFDKVAGTPKEDGTLDCAKAEKTMSGLKVVSDTEFQVTLAGPVSIFKTVIGYSVFSPLPESFFKDQKAFEAKPIGNGPFMFKSRKPNQEIALTAYPDYKGDDVPQVKDITFKIYQTPDAAYVDLLANNLDVMDTMPTTALAGDRWQSELGDRWVLQPTGVFQNVVFPMYDKQFQNADLRKAISMAIDREQVIKVAFNNTRTPANGWVPPVVDGYKANTCGENCEYNPTKAKELLKKAGGFTGTLTIAYNGDGGHKEWVDATCISIKNALGIKCQGKAYPDFKSLRDDVDEQAMTGVFRAGWVMDYPSIQNFLEPLYSTNGLNDGKYSNKEFDALMAKAKTVPVAEANKLYQEGEAILAKDMPSIPLWYGALSAGWSTNIETPAFTPFGRVDLTSLKLKG